MSPPLTPYKTYTLAHTAQCKLKLAANRPDRNLRFVLGHAVLLDNVLVRIVEIENQSAKDAFAAPSAATQGGAGTYDCAATKKSSPLNQSTTVDNDQQPEGKRRVSFQDNNARPNLSAGEPQSQRSKSPPPPPTARRDESSSDDYDDPDEDEDDGLGLTRFASASAQKPRHRVPSPPPPPALSSSSSSDSEDEEEQIGPVSPPAFPTDLDLTQIIQGPEDTELGDLYESVRRCGCHGHSDNDEVGERGGKMWALPENEEKKNLALMTVGRGAGVPVAVTA